MKPIAIDRKAGRKAVEQVVEQGLDRLNRGIWVVIFPEGTRVPPGKRLRYRIGGAILAARSGRPVVPVAHNAGEFWRKGQFVLSAGTIRMVIGPPIPTAGRKPPAPFAWSSDLPFRPQAENPRKSSPTPRTGSSPPWRKSATNRQVPDKSLHFCAVRRWILQNPRP